MKKILLISFLLLISTEFVFADLVVIYNKSTKEVYSVSEKDDTIIPEGYEKVVTSGNLSDFTDENPLNYKFVNKKFVKDIDKISKQEQKKTEDKEKSDEEKLIQDRIEKIAIDQLKSEGVMFKYN